MNRRTKRNKYRKLQKKLENTIAFFERLPYIENCFKEKKEIKVLSCFESVDKYLGVPEDVAKNLSKNEVARQFAEEITKHPELIRKTDLGFGIRYDLFVVEN